MLKLVVSPHSEIPIRIRRMLKLIRLLLRQPQLAIIDQKSLNLENTGPKQLIQILQN